MLFVFQALMVHLLWAVPAHVLDALFPCKAMSMLDESLVVVSILDTCGIYEDMRRAWGGFREVGGLSWFIKR